MLDTNRLLHSLSHAVAAARTGGHVTIPCYDSRQKIEVVKLLKLIDPDFGLLPITIEVLHDA